MNTADPEPSMEPLAVPGLLEALGSTEEAAAVPPRQHQHQTPQRTPAQKKLLAAATEHGVQLLLMPSGMARREANTSSAGGKHAAIHWRIEFEFPGSSVEVESIGGGGGAAERHRVVVDRACHDLSWLSLLAPRLAKAGAVARHQLRRYCNAIEKCGGGGGGGPGEAIHQEGEGSLSPKEDGNRDAGFRLLLKQEPGPANAPLFYELSPTQSIKRSLAGKTIIEFPTVLVVLADELSRFSLVPPLVTELEVTESSVDPESKKNGGVAVAVLP
eukprot:CAMPEP_0171973788 /NCGR_PEP_ID=MMETSP0993-20121228/229478_1 /TAXON_ID=483369 /ORGANISM="non described non described, Strain CCMP2098" /LENGTH=271 /DNA_ID=CAMNT_0012624657 /DNA_START=394 /DNA_END=1209 /DNA_ORIENTATION=+